MKNRTVSRIKKILLLMGILVLIITNAVLYWGQHLYYRADRESNEARKIQLLEQSAGLIPFDAAVYFELGTTYYERAARNLNEPQYMHYLDESIRHLQRSVRLNPGAYQTHYALGRALLYVSYLDPENPDFFSEYWKAAQLTTFDNDLYFEIGRILFSLWPELEDAQKAFTLEIFNNVIQTKDNQRLWQVLQIWAAHVEDYDVIDSILPEKPGAYRMYARFLGERSLSLEKRQVRLAQAEYMEFEEAKQRFYDAQADFRLYRLKQANNKYRESHRMLEKIHFFQNLLPDSSFIDMAEYENLFKLSLLGIIQSYAMQPDTLEKVKEYFDRYLEIETDPATLERLEEFFAERGWLEARPGGEDNPLRLYYRISLDYAQSRYREIAGLAPQADEMEFSFQDKYRDELTDIFRMIGNAYQNIDFIYDAADYYQKALQMDPDNLKTLLKLRNSHLRFNNEEKMAEVDERINAVLIEEGEVLEDFKLEKNRVRDFPLKIRPGKVNLRISVQPSIAAFSPLLSVFLNGKVIQEEYADVSPSDPFVMIPVSISSVQNIIQIKSVNQDVFIEKIIIGYEND